MSDVDVMALGRRAEAMIRDLAVISAEEGRITRLYLTREHRRAADRVAGWMSAAGLDVHEDELGTVRGRLPSAGERAGANEARRLLIGSHIDTVIDAGAYDGTLGVVAGILATEHIAKSRGAMPFGIDVLAFGDEEGSRFPAALLCSNAIAGSFDPAVLDVEAVDGITLRDALIAYGKDVRTAPTGSYRPGEALAYVEAHIEQGPVLEAKGEALGIVTAIAAQSRLSVTVVGEAGHAGTVPMRMRRDALAATAEMMAALEAIAADNASDFMVATVGRLAVSPGASNVIPARVVFSVDLRSQSDAVKDGALGASARRCRTSPTGGASPPGSSAFTRRGRRLNDSIMLAPHQAHPMDRLRPCATWPRFGTRCALGTFASAGTQPALLRLAVGILLSWRRAVV